jgi:hypothetical protein
MAWIDDLARWAADPRPRAREWDDGGLLTRRLSRRGALGAFGAAAGALAIGTLGDPPRAEAVQRCCDPNHNGTWSCIDGSECCCYLIPGGGGHNECCDTAKGQTCKAHPGQTDHGVQVVACCYTMCANECCPTPEEVCDSHGNCLSCGDLERCGDDCCAPDHRCESGICMITCPEGQQSCGEICCATGEDCVEGACLAKCKPDAMRCGADHACCAPGETCQDGKCAGCALPTMPCDDVCCDEGQYCDTSAMTAVCADCPAGQSQCVDTCCPDTTVCHPVGRIGTCVCPQGVFCEDRCCAADEHCTPAGCVPCPAGMNGCGSQCCEPQFGCTDGRCDCEQGQQLCGPVCCQHSDECVSGQCVPKCEIEESRCGTSCCPPGHTCEGGHCEPCPSTTIPCGDACCTPPMTCFATGICRCPAGQVACATGCCPSQAAPGTEAAHATVPNTVQVRHGAAEITVSCTGGCSGTVTLESSGAAHASLRALVAGRHRPVVLGTAKFTVPAGRKSKAVRVHLSHTGTRYLAKHHSTLKSQALIKTAGHKKAFLTRVFTLRGIQR